MSNTTGKTYVQALIEGGHALGIEIGASVCDAMAAHDRLMRKWAKKINLTTVVAPSEAAVLHGLDSLLFAEVIAPDCADVTYDIGSGAGFPGVVVALARPRLRMTLLEPSRKKTSFLRVVLAEVGRADVRVEAGRLERPAGAPEWTAGRIISRATIPPLELVPRAGLYLAPGGRLTITGGANASPVSALDAVAAPVGLTHVDRRTWTLPGGLERVLDTFDKAP